MFTEHSVLKNFNSIIDEAADAGVEYLELTPSDGEIFTDKDILNKLRYATNRIKTVMFYTNFGLCTPKIIDELLTIKLDIRISDYGCNDKDVFEFMTRTKSFETYQNNLEYARKVGLDFRLYNRMPDENIYYDNSNENIDDMYKGKNLPVQNTEGVCSYLYFPRIMANGDFVVCSCSGGILSLDEKMIIGNIYEDQLKDLMSSYKRKEFYTNHSNGDYNDFCKTCPMFSRTDIKPNIKVLRRFL